MTKRELSTLRKICDSIRAKDDVYETVKVVNGHEIKRLKGSSGFYHVNVKENDGKGSREFHTFRSVKAAEEFIKTALRDSLSVIGKPINQFKGRKGVYTVLKVKENGAEKFLVTSEDVSKPGFSPAGTVENTLAEAIKTAKRYAASDSTRDGKEKQIARGIGWEVYYHDGRYYVDYFNGKPIGGHKTLQGAKEELYYAGKIPSKTAELKSDYTKDAETHYLINGKVFRTQEEAEGYEKLYRKKTGVFLAIERTNRAVTHTFDKNAKDAISPDQPDVIKVTTRYPDYIDFIIGSDKQNLYRYEKATGKMRKILGVGKGNFGNAIRGIDRKKVESVAKIVFERKLPFAVIA